MQERECGAGACLAVLVGAGCDEFVAYRLWRGGLALRPPQADILPGGKQVFHVSGGSPPHRFALLEGAGSLSPIGDLSVEYSAPAVSTQARVRATDGLEALAEAQVVVEVPSPPLEVRPDPAAVPIGDALTFNASGGILPYTFLLDGVGQLTPGPQEGEALYNAPAPPGQARLRIEDGSGLRREITIRVYGSLAILPAQVSLTPGTPFPFSAEGGCRSTPSPSASPREAASCPRADAAPHRPTRPWKR